MVYHVLKLIALATFVAGQTNPPTRNPAFLSNFPADTPTRNPLFASNFPAVTPTRNPLYASNFPAVTPTQPPLDVSNVPVAGIPTPVPAPMGSLPPIVPTEPTTLAPDYVLVLPPVLSTFPTPPGGNPVCLVCGEGFLMTYRDVNTTLGGNTLRCGDVEAAGYRGLIPKSVCDRSLQESIATTCQCNRIEYSSAPSQAPPTAGPTNRPSGATIVNVLMSSALAVGTIVVLLL